MSFKGRNQKEKASTFWWLESWAHTLSNFLSLYWPTLIFGSKAFTFTVPESLVDSTSNLELSISEAYKKQSSVKMEPSDHQKTTIKQYTKSFKWDIEGFSILYPNVFLEDGFVTDRNTWFPARAKSLIGPTFLLEMGSIVTEWKARLLLNLNENRGGSAALDLTTRNLDRPINLTVILRLNSIKNVETNRVIRKVIDTRAVLALHGNSDQVILHSEPLVHQFSRGTELHWRSFISLRKLWKKKDSYFPDNVLRIRLKLVTIGEASHKNVSPKKDVDLSVSLAEDLSTLWNSGVGADFAIICGRENFKVHKTILAARSPVFARMFESHTKEVSTSSVTIQDVDPETLRYLLAYIYTSKVDEDEISVDELQGLAQAADKYMLEQLKERCFQLLLNQMDISNCGDLAVLLYFHSDDLDARKYVFKFCHRNWRLLREKDAFKKLVKDYPAAFLRP